jgi:hypothetical protein
MDKYLLDLIKFGVCNNFYKGTNVHRMVGDKIIVNVFLENNVTNIVKS